MYQVTSGPFDIYSKIFPPFLGRVGSGATDQAARTHGLIPNAAPPVPAVLITVRAVMGGCTAAFAPTCHHL